MVPLFFFAQAPSNPKMFWFYTLAACPLEVMAAVLFQKALKLSDLSTTMPFMAFTPVFLIGMSWLFLGEIIAPLGILGIVSVTSGAFFVVRSPQRKKTSMAGAWLMLIVALIYSFTAVLAKKALLNSSPLFFCAAYYPLIGLGLVPILLQRGSKISDAFVSPCFFAAVGLCEALSFFIQFHAFMHIEIAYAVAIKRLSLLLALVYGRFLFKEEIRPIQTLGGLLMVLGAILILVTG